MEKEYFKGELVSYRDMSKVYHNGYEGTLPKSKLDFFIADIFLQKPLKRLGNHGRMAFDF